MYKLSSRLAVLFAALCFGLPQQTAACNYSYTLDYYGDQYFVWCKPECTGTDVCEFDLCSNRCDLGYITYCIGDPYCNFFNSCLPDDEQHFCPPGGGQ